MKFAKIFKSYFSAFTIVSFCSYLTTALNDARDLLLDPEEKYALDKFKLQVADLVTEDYMKSDFYLIRWLRVSELSIPKAQFLLQQTMNWRKTNNVSTILSEDFSDVAEDFPITFPGHDKAGRPIFTIDAAEWDLRKAVVQGKIPRVKRYLIRCTEQSQQYILDAQRSYRGGKPVTRQLVLMDAEGFNLFQQGCVQCLTVFSYWASLGGTHYPLFNDEVILVNVPPIAHAAINTFRTFLPEEEKRIMKVFDSNRRVWQKYLDARIDRDQRPKRYGGTH